MSRFIDGVHELYHVRVYEDEVKVEVKMYESYWDKDMVESGNAFHTRQEAEFIASKIREIFASSGQLINKHKEKIGS